MIVKSIFEKNACGIKRCLGIALMMLLSHVTVHGQVGKVDITQFEAHRHIDGNDTLPYQLYTSDAAKMHSDSPLPLVIFLHGAGERGNDNIAQFTHCVEFFVDDAVSKQYPFILLCPQCPNDKRWVDTDWKLPSHTMDSMPTPQMEGVLYLMDSLVASGIADPERIYIAGISMGGFGTWDALQRRPHTFAAAIAICGGGDPAYTDNLVDVPIKIFHGQRDKLVKPSRSQMMFDAIEIAGGKKASLTMYSDLGHLCWNKAFATPGLFDWLFGQQLNNN